jgi:hypothetical protein
MRTNQFITRMSVLAAVVSVLSLSFLSNADAQRRRVYVGRAWPGRTAVLPGNHYAVMVHGQRYFYSDGYFYRPYRRGYMLTPAPLGARINVLPFGFLTLRVGTIPYYYFGGVYYQYIPDENVYVVVQKPSGASPTTTAVSDNNDRAILTDGTTLSGVFMGASEDSVQFQVSGEVRSIPVTKITSINFAPSAFDTSGHK